MRCEQARELLPAYVDDSVPHEASLQVHLATCADCSRALAGYRSLLSDLAGLGEQPRAPSAELVERLLISVPSSRIRARVRTTIARHPVLVTLASLGAGAAIGAATAVLVVRRLRSAAAPA